MSNSATPDNAKLPTFVDALDVTARGRWAARLGVTEAALLRAVRTVGARTSTVRAHLGLRG